MHIIQLRICQKYWKIFRKFKHFNQKTMKNVQFFLKVGDEGDILKKREI